KRAAQAISASSSLAVRERNIVRHYMLELAALLAAETGAAPDDVEPLAAAATLMVVHRMLVDHVRQQVVAGSRGSRLVEDFKSEARRAFRRLENGLGDYAVRA
ncbi:MAG: hypothetical protein QOG08_773, partial [Chloroflexota bacterium]|nr:hypothetical protein [Chloroflexota bacterium]